MTAPPMFNFSALPTRSPRLSAVAFAARENDGIHVLPLGTPARTQ